MILTLVVIYIIGAALIGYPIASASLAVWKKGWETQPDKVGHGFVGFLVFPYSCWNEYIGDPFKVPFGLFLSGAHTCDEMAAALRYKRFTTTLWPLRVVANLFALGAVAVLAFELAQKGFGPKQDII